jgi:hypothetical protein
MGSPDKLFDKARNIVPAIDRGSAPNFFSMHTIANRQHILSQAQYEQVSVSRLSPILILETEKQKGKCNATNRRDGQCIVLEYPANGNRFSCHIRFSTVRFIWGIYRGQKTHCQDIHAALISALL